METETDGILLVDLPLPVDLKSSDRKNPESRDSERVDTGKKTRRLYKVRAPELIVVKAEV